MYIYKRSIVNFHDFPKMPVIRRIFQRAESGIMSEYIKFPMNEEELRNKTLYESPDRALAYGKPLRVSDYEALPAKYRVLDDTFARYHTRDPRDFYHVNPIRTNENDQYVVLTRSLRYTIPFLHCHNCVEIFYVYSGECCHYVDGTRHSLKTGDFCIVGPDSVHAIENTHDEDVIFSILVDLDFFGKNFLSLLRKSEKISEFFQNVVTRKIPTSSILYPTGDDPWMHGLILHLYEGNRSHDYLYNESVSLGIRQLFIHILRNYEMDAVISLPAEKEERYPFVALINYLTVNYNQATLHHTAEFFGYSDVYLGQLVKKVTGKPFTEYITEIQLEKACELLKDTALSLTEIAQEIGCYDSSHFTNKFRKKYGVTPSVYRKRLP